MRGGITERRRRRHCRTKKDVVTLSGTVSAEASRQPAVDIALNVARVKQVKDNMKVNPGG